MPIGKQSKDFDFIMKDAGVTVTFTDENGELTCGFGTVEDSDVDMVGVEEGTIPAHAKVVTVSREHFPTLGAGAQLRVDGVDYRATQVREAGDGLPLRVWCVRTG